MTLPASGLITLTDIETEFGGSPPTSLGEYYAGGLYVNADLSAIPSSGAINMAAFYGARNWLNLTVSSNTLNLNVYDLAIANGWTTGTNISLTIDTGVYIWSDSTALAGLLIPEEFGLGVGGADGSIAINIINNGYIIGKGGKGGGLAGGPAIRTDYNDGTKINITNNASAYIAGGGGGGGYVGGGGGAGGGDGGKAWGTAGVGGAIGAEGTDAYETSHTDTTSATGGGAGAGGGAAWDYGSGNYGPESGAGGGRILPGSGGIGGINTGGCGGFGSRGCGGNGGAGGAIGSNYIGGAGSGGGGGWGANGGSGAGASAGGVGGKSIYSSAVGFVTPNITNSGTIYGLID